MSGRQRWLPLLSHASAPRHGGRGRDSRRSPVACCHLAGWSELDRTSDPDGDFNLWWKNGRFKPSELEEARCHGARRINHFSKSNVITRKDSLLRAMRRMRSTHGAIYSFTPRGFLLPSEYTKFVKAFAAQGTASVPAALADRPRLH